MKIKKSELRFIFSLFFKSVFILLICILILGLCYDKAYRIVALLPFSYMAVNIFYSSKQKKAGRYSGGIIYKAALTVIFIRYVITPLSIALSGKFYFYRVYTLKESIDSAVFLMIFELFSLYMTLYFARNYYSKKHESNIPDKVEMLNHKFALIIAALLGTAVVLLVEPNLLIPADFLVLGRDYQRIKLDVPYDGLYFALAELVKPIIFLVLFSVVKEKYDSGKSKACIWISFILIILLMGMYTGTQRWEIVFAGIIGLFLLRITYDKIPKSLVLGVIAVMFISFISISLYKYSWTVQNSENPVKDIIIELFGMFQDYFSGPRVVANSIEMNNVYGSNIGLSTFINDFAGSIPVISNFVDQSDRINVYFNLYHNLSNKTLIIPMVGIGYSYFPFFPPIFTAICEWFLIKVDYKLKTSKSVEFKYLYLYFGLYLSMCLGFNTQIIFGKFLIPFLPLLILFKVNERFCLKKRRKFMIKGIRQENLTNA